MIYIPLWFYLYRESEYHNAKTANLHSTMVLLIQNKNACRLGKILIYIPLWFYLYRQRSRSRRLKKQIYIPLWFYLYDEARFRSRAGSGIYIPLWFYLYGGAGMSCKGLHFNLHSTMVLLIPAPGPYLSSRAAIYIPLWFYLYRRPVYADTTL